MIEQTELVVKEWTYVPPATSSAIEEKIIIDLEFDVMKKRVSTKKGIACRFTSRFLRGEKLILIYVGEDSYVIDLDDYVDKAELQTMIRNSYTKYNEKFEFSKLNTILQNISLLTLDESLIDYESILPLLV